MCPACFSPIWPPSSISDTGSCLYSRLKESIIQSGLQKNVFGSHLVSLPASENHIPPAFASDPLKRISAVEDTDDGGTVTFNSVRGPRPTLSLVATDDKYLDEVYNSTFGTGSYMFTAPVIIEVDGPDALENHFVQDQEPHLVRTPGATTRKPIYHDRNNFEASSYADDEDGTDKKYNRRGPLRHKFLRMLLPFWSNQLPTLPVTAPVRKESNPNSATEGKVRHQRSSRMDPRKILLIMAIVLVQRSLDESIPEDEAQ